MIQTSATMTVAVLGGDMRQIYLANYISRQGYSVSCYLTPPSSVLLPAVRQSSSLREALADHTVIIGPVPFSRDGKTIAGETGETILLSDFYSLLEKKHVLIGGNLPSSALSICIEQEIPYYDFMNSEVLAYHNAEITAEGMLCEIMKNTPFTVQNKQVLIMGYGRCGSILAHKLQALGCRVSICELAEGKRELAASYGFRSFSPSHLKNFLSRFSMIVNTVPALILNKEIFSVLSPDCFLFDLASPPGGIDFEAAKENSNPVFYCPGLPGKIAPLSAGEAIGKIIMERITDYDRF